MTRYLVHMNLGGLHRKVLKVKYDKPTDRYWDKTGRISYCEWRNKIDGASQLLFKTKRDAEIALQGAVMVANFLIERLK